MGSGLAFVEFALLEKPADVSVVEGDLADFVRRLLAADGTGISGGGEDADR